MKSKYFLPIALLASIFIMSCGSDSKKAEAKTSSTEQIKQAPAAATATTPSKPQPPQETSKEKMSASVIGTAMNAATAIAVSGIGIAENNYEKEKLISANQSVQKAFKELSKFKDENSNYFAPDSQNFKFFTAFSKFTEASKKMISEVDSGNLKSYNAALNNAYNVLAKIYGEL